MIHPWQEIFVKLNINRTVQMHNFMCKKKEIISVTFKKL